jgi:hypothetical protein
MLLKAKKDEDERLKEYIQMRITNFSQPSYYAMNAVNNLISLSIVSKYGNSLRWAITPAYSIATGKARSYMDSEQKEDFDEMLMAFDQDAMRTLNVKRINFTYMSTQTAVDIANWLIPIAGEQIAELTKDGYLTAENIYKAVYNVRNGNPTMEDINIYHTLDLVHNISMLLYAGTPVSKDINTVLKSLAISKEQELKEYR